MPQEKPEQKQDSKPAELDTCVDALLAEGYDEERAYAICTAAQKADSLFAGYVKGYASIFGNLDKDFEVVDQGAFTDWLEANPNEPLPFLWIHKRELMPVGLTTKLIQDEKGLYYEAAILDTAKGRDLFKAIEAGAVSASSFAYEIQDQYEKDGVWHLSKLDLLEISAVTKGMSSNPQATVEILDEKTEIETPVEASEPSAMEVFEAELHELLEQIGGKE